MAVGSVWLAVTGGAVLRTLAGIAGGNGVVPVLVVGLAVDHDADSVIDRLIEQVRQLEDGDYDLDLPTDRSDRIGELASELDELAATLATGDGPDVSTDRETRATPRGESLFEAVFADTGMLVGLLDPDGTHRRSNETAMSYIDADREAVAGVPFWETPWWAGHEDAQSMIREKIERAATGEYVSYEADLTDASGERFSREGTIRPVTEDGEVVSLVVSARDVTERKERERELEQYRSLVNSMRDSACIYDAEGRFAVVNRALANFYQTTPEDLEGRQSHLVEHVRASAEGDGDPYQELVDGHREEIRGEFESTYPDAGYAVVEYRMTRLTMGGEFEGVVAVARDVTERREHERQFRAIVENTINPIYIKDREGTYQFANEASAKFFGLDRDELVGKTDRELFEEESAASIREDDRGILETGDSIVTERTVNVDGERAAFLDNKYPYRDENGDIVGIIGISREITERKEKERELERYREFTNDILDAIDDVFYALDSDGNLARWNESLTDVTGYDDTEIASMHATDFFAETDRPDIEAAIREVAETGHARVEVDFLTSDGETIPHEFVATQVQTPDGESVVAGIGRNVSERKEREEQLREQERELSTLIGNIPGMVYRCANEPEWPFEFVSEGCRAVTGYAPGEIEAGEVNWGEDVIDDDNEEIWDAVQRAIDEREPFQLTYRIEDADGERRWLWEQGRGVFDDDGDLQALEGVIMDITERKERERELERTKDLLAIAGEMADMGGWSVDQTGEPPHVAELTDKQYELFGLSPGEHVRAEELLEYFHPEDREGSLKAIENAIETGEGWEEEVRIVTADGTERWIRTIADTVVEDGEVVEIRGSTQDVSERKERERELERTTDLLAFAQEMADVGGWSVDRTGEPPYTPQWTDEHYEIFELTHDETPDTEQVFEFFHPDDRDRLRDAITNAIRTGERWDEELRITTAEGTERWVRSIGDGIVEDGETVELRGSTQDITDQKRRELALESLHDAARRLLGTETERDVTDLVIDVAAEVVDTPAVGIYLLDVETNTLEPTAFTDSFADLYDGPPAVTVGDADSLVWNTFVTETRTIVEDGEATDGTGLFDDGVRNGVLVPIGDHGVFVALSQDGRIDATTRQLVETLVATTEAALDRLDSEATIRERDAELKAQNERLRRQVQITEIIRSIDQSLIGTNTHEEIERAVCERLVADDTIGFAWVGSLGPDGESVTARQWAGEGESYLDAIAADGTAATPEPAWQAARTESPVSVENVVDDLQREGWRKPALAHDFHSAIAVPLVFDEYSYGVLAVYATEPDAFGELERAVFAELGETIANSITAAKTRQALHAETLLELELRFEDADDLLARIAREADCRVEYEGLATVPDDDDRVFFVARDADPDAVRDVLDGLVSVTGSRLISDADGYLFEVTTAAPLVAAKLVSHGGRPQSITADHTGMDVVVDLPTGTDVREFVEMLREDHPSVELGARRHVKRSTHTRRELVTTLFEALTDRQREVLETAYLAGFFEQPRETTGEELAEMLGVSQPTVNRHLRLAQQRLMEQLFSTGPEETG